MKFKAGDIIRNSYYTLLIKGYVEADEDFYERYVVISLMANSYTIDIDHKPYWLKCSTTDSNSTLIDRSSILYTLYGD